MIIFDMIRQLLVSKKAEESATLPTPVSRALSMVGKGEYWLGTGDYRPRDGKDEPWTARDGHVGSDCAGFAQAWCHQIARHRPGYNKGGSVEDWINTDSGIEDACGVCDESGREIRGPLHEIYEEPPYPTPGDLLVYASVRSGTRRVLIGHVAIVVAVPDGFDPSSRKWSRLEVVQCRGPNGRRPGVVRTDGSIWESHDRRWAVGASWRRSRLLRVT